MNLFNRIFTVASILVLIILGLGILLVPAGLAVLVNSLLQLVDISQGIIRILVAIVVFGIGVLLLWLEFRRPGSRTVEVVRSTGGRIHITTGHVEERIAQQVDALSGVISSRVRVSERDKAVMARVDVQAAPDLDLVAKGEEIATVTRMVVQDQLGLKLYGKPQITIQPSKVKPVPISPVKSPSADNGNSTASTTTGDKV